MNEAIELLQAIAEHLEAIRGYCGWMLIFVVAGFFLK